MEWGSTAGIVGEGAGGAVAKAKAGEAGSATGDQVGTRSVGRGAAWELETAKGAAEAGDAPTGDQGGGGGGGGGGTSRPKWGGEPAAAGGISTGDGASRRGGSPARPRGT